MERMSISFFLRKYLPRIGTTKCRHCGSDNVRLSYGSNAGTKFLIFRCRACGKHFRSGINLSVFMPIIVTIITITILTSGVFISMYYGGSGEEGVSKQTDVIKPNY
jgi:hypothetical protein